MLCTPMKYCPQGLQAVRVQSLLRTLLKSFMTCFTSGIYPVIRLSD